MKSTSLLAAAVGAAFSAAAAAQAPFPNKPVHVIVTIPAGGAADVILRIAAPEIQKNLGQPLVLENRPAMSGVIAAEQVAKAPGDGYTLLFTTPSSQITVKFISKNVRYDPEKDFTPITAFVEPVSTLVVHPSVPAKDLKEFIAYAKKNPGKLAYGTPGVGSVFHLVGEAFREAADIDVLHVPYKGTITAVNDLAGGQIQWTLSAFPNVKPFLQTGKLRLLAWASSKRYSAYPDVPTVTEILPNFEAPPSWFGMFGPAGIPRPVLTRLNGDMVKALNQPDIKSKIEDLGNSVIANSPEEYAALMKRGIAIFGKVFKAAGLKPED
jgi:tripartite-type tricarboxylate transporter receptor subunit TctC